MCSVYLSIGHGQNQDLTFGLGNINSLGGWTQITGLFYVRLADNDGQNDETDMDLTVTLTCENYEFSSAAAAGSYFLFDDFQFSVA